jgi:Tfp pilus assembly protein FimV
MQCNYKLKQAVAIALGIFALGLQQQAMALGLGELDVKSHLGQPFRAKIKVHDATDLKAGDFNNGSCFRLGESVDSGSALNGVNFKLGMLDNDEAILTLSTVQVVNEPILNLSIIAECGSAVRRDYVVLLDPVSTTETENAADDEVVPAAEEIVTKANKPAKARHHQITESVVTHSESKSHNTKKSSKNKILNTENNNNVVLHVPGGNANSQTNSL